MKTKFINVGMLLLLSASNTRTVVDPNSEARSLTAERILALRIAPGSLGCATIEAFDRTLSKTYKATFKEILELSTSLTPRQQEQAISRVPNLGNLTEKRFCLDWRFSNLPDLFHRELADIGRYSTAVWDPNSIFEEWEEKRFYAHRKLLRDTQKALEELKYFLSNNVEADPSSPIFQEGPQVLQQLPFQQEQSTTNAKFEEQPQRTACESESADLNETVEPAIKLLLLSRSYKLQRLPLSNVWPPLKYQNTNVSSAEESAAARPGQQSPQERRGHPLPFIGFLRTVTDNKPTGYFTQWQKWNPGTAESVQKSV
jgi:hypothetical protein